MIANKANGTPRFPPHKSLDNPGIPLKNRVFRLVPGVKTVNPGGVVRCFNCGNRGVCFFLLFAFWSLIWMLWELLWRGFVYYHIECIGKLRAQAFLHDPRLIVVSRDTPKVNRCMCPIVDWTGSWREERKCIEEHVPPESNVCAYRVWQACGVS